MNVSHPNQLQPAKAEVDWLGAARAALSSAAVAALVGDGLHLLTRWMEEQQRQAQSQAQPQSEPDPDEDDDFDLEALAAATKLGVSLDATADQIRAALRNKMRNDRLHPDHGGDGEEAKRMIAAQNLLLERAKEAA